ncbi:MAG: hypothetical protein FJ291_00720 [Planctomycetes bacterium]|nr:hypothetical protein [Planctomycetota bacterium]
MSGFVWHALLGLFIVASVFALAAGVACFLNAAVWALKREWHRSLRWALVGAPVLLIPTWIWASIFAEIRVTGQMHQCETNLRRAIYPTLLEYRLRHPDAPLPTGWPRPDREPMCAGSGEPLPYAYLPVPDLGEAASADPPGWLAYCPKPHRARPWWTLRFLGGGCDRVVLDASGWAISMSEAEFQAGLRRLHALGD